MSTTKKLVLLAAICCLFSVGSLSAAQITQTCNFGSAGSPIILSNISSVSCSFQMFNTAWGSLSDVAVSLSNIGGTEWPVVTNSSAATTAFDGVDMDLKITLKNTTLGASVNATTPLSSPTCAGNVSIGNTVACNGTAGGVTNSTTAFSGIVGTTQDPAPGGPAWALYQAAGGGTIATSFTASAIAQIQDGNLATPGMTAGGDGTVYGTLTLTYTYSSGVPEPATLSLVGGSLIALGVIARKRRKA